MPVTRYQCQLLRNCLSTYPCLVLDSSVFCFFQVRNISTLQLQRFLLSFNFLLKSHSNLNLGNNVMEAEFNIGYSNEQYLQTDCCYFALKSLLKIVKFILEITNKLFCKVMPYDNMLSTQNCVSGIFLNIWER